jgi:hypothetical protein
VGYEQAVIKVEKESEFAELKSAIERTFAVGSVEKFLKRLESRGIRIRNFDLVLEKRVLEYVDGGLKQTGKSAKTLYETLPLSDQAQMREFYLSKLETVETELRHRFKKLYQYY